MTEWLIVPVLKTGGPKGSVGSNPTSTPTGGFMKIPKSYSIYQENYNPGLGCRLKVFLDGVEQKYVVSYTPNEVERYEIDPAGNIVVINGRASTETVRGSVEVLLE